MNVEEKDIWDTSFGQDTFSMHNFFKRRAKFHQLIFLYCENLKFFLYSTERGKHYAQKRWFKNDDAYCGGDVHIIHTWVNGLHILIFSINLVKCRKPAPQQLLFLSANFWAEPSAVFPLFFSSVYNSLMIRHSINCPLCSKLNFPEIENSVRIVLKILVLICFWFIIFSLLLSRLHAFQLWHVPTHLILCLRKSLISTSLHISKTSLASLSCIADDQTPFFQFSRKMVVTKRGGTLCLIARQISILKARAVLLIDHGWIGSIALAPAHTHPFTNWRRRVFFTKKLKAFHTKKWSLTCLTKLQFVRTPPWFLSL